jgi:triacylglycerol esterase/lipase EstA (alpha/beta hydrolase family)
LSPVRRTAVAPALAALLAVAISVPPASAVSGQRTTPVIFVHGFFADVCPTGLRVASAMSGPTAELADDGWTGALDVVSYYACDQGGTRIGSDTANTSIRRIGAQLAGYIYRTYTRHDRPVDIVAHSIGGLAARTAIKFTADHARGFPPALLVDRVVTFSTPFAGVDRTAIRAVPGLRGTREARQVRMGSAFLRDLAGRPVAPGTRWLVIGSSGGCDLVHAASALAVPGALRIRYTGCWSHTDYLSDATATRSYPAYRDGVRTRTYGPLKQMSMFLAKP